MDLKAHPQGLPLFVQMDDPELVEELKGEETLQELQEIEFQRESLNLSRGVGLSFIPGGGWGLFYAQKRAQGLIPLVASLIGYGVGLALLSGSLDTDESRVCVYSLEDSTRNYAGTIVNSRVCEGKTNPNIQVQLNLENDPLSWVDTNGNQLADSNEQKKYLETLSYYSFDTRGSKYDGFQDGLLILGITYLTTTAIGAIWSAVEISQFNDELRKKVESTADLSPKFQPYFHRDGQKTMVGVGVLF
jgi:hypothetical protein